VVKVVMIVDYKLKPNCRANFVRVMRENACGTLEEIDGCEQFDVLISDGDPNQAFAYEVFENDAAYRRYAASGRVPRIREAYKDMVVDRRIVRCLSE
jgi:quinol monooxygenase YgiN